MYEQASLIHSFVSLLYILEIEHCMLIMAGVVQRVHEEWAGHDGRDGQTPYDSRGVFGSSGETTSRATSSASDDGTS